MSFIFLKSIKVKLLLAIFVVCLCLSFLLSTQILSRYDKHLSETLISRQKAIAISIRSLLNNRLDNFRSFDSAHKFKVQGILEEVYNTNPGLNYIYISSNSGVILFKYDPDNSVDSERVANFDRLADLKFEIDSDISIYEDNYESIIPIIGKNKLSARIHVGTSRNYIDMEKNELLNSIIFIFVVTLVLSTPFAYFLIFHIVVKPLDHLSALVKKIAKNRDFNDEIEFHSSIEFERIFKDFNLMNSSLKNYYLDIEALNKNLELIVKERTEELLLSSKKLESKNAKLEETLAVNEKMQEVLIQQEKLASLGEVVAGIAHEINNPLNFVINGAMMAEGFLNKVINDSDLDKESIESLKSVQIGLEMAKKNGSRATSIVQNMLGHARGATGAMEVTNLKNTVDEFLKLAIHSSRGKGGLASISVEKFYDPDLPLVSTVKQDIERVILNIFNNSLYALEKKAEQQDDSFIPKLTIKLTSVDCDVHLVIHDNGVGIRKEVKDRIFDPFFTTKPSGEGTGLGMSMCHEIIKNGHGGEISIESVEGEFTEFFIRLPIKSGVDNGRK